MLDWLFIMLLVIAIILVLITIFEDLGTFWDISFIIISTIIMFTLAASIMDIETPYTLYNATSGNIETGYHTTQSSVAPYISYLFIALGFVMMVYFIGYVLGPTIVRNIRRYR